MQLKLVHLAASLPKLRVRHRRRNKLLKAAPLDLQYVPSSSLRHRPDELVKVARRLSQHKGEPKPLKDVVDVVDTKQPLQDWLLKEILD